MLSAMSGRGYPGCDGTRAADSCGPRARAFFVPASRQHQPYGRRMMSAACTTIDIAKHLVAEHDRREYESAGVAGSRVAEPVDAQGRGGVGEWPVAQQRPAGVGQDHSFGVGVALDFLAELLGPARSASARP